MCPSSRVTTKSLSLSITNPLVLYRALVATKKIRPDPAQHRLALQLQKLYFRLKDYAPEVEYRYRLEKIGRRVARKSRTGTRIEHENGAEQGESPSSASSGSNRDEGDARSTTTGGFISSLVSRSLSTSLSASSLALTRTTPLHDSALTINSPLGMLLYGEVGRGKSMLLDILYTSLPSRKKRRWHYNTFMLDVFRRIETARLERLELFEDSLSSLGTLFGRGGPRISEHEHVVLSLAKDTISDSPILFLDEFQMPDRTASKLITSFFTAFFHLGGVLVASSNRMPEELSKAAGIEFGGQHQDPRRWGGSFGGGFFGLGWGLSRASEGERAARTDFGKFVELLRARCEVWEMEGEKDWRREDDDGLMAGAGSAMDFDSEEEIVRLEDEKLPIWTGTSLADSAQALSSDSPPHYHITLPTSSSTSSTTSPIQMDISTLNPSNTWIPRVLTIYARKLHLPQTHGGILRSRFSSLCETYLGSADYISLCSHFHTLILTDVPVLTLAKKNEARRFITLLDALYEARCRLVIEAEAPPDRLFFPETRMRVRTRQRDGDLESPLLYVGDGAGGDNTTSDDAITSEAFSEIYQDSTAPFRPNVSLYSDSDPSYRSPATSMITRHLLADEDADFGPTYGNGRGHGISDSSVPPSPSASSIHSNRSGPDFTSTSALTGEDERFAYKRARSRLWEMCGRRWWDERLPMSRHEKAQPAGVGSMDMRRDQEINAHDYSREKVTQEEGEEWDAPEWWRPLTHEGRFWELQDPSSPSASTATSTPYAEYIPTPMNDRECNSHKYASTSARDERSSPAAKTNSNTSSSAPAPPHPPQNSSSPYRAETSPPPKFGWQHAWGMLRWGPKAGEWGKGVDGKGTRNQNPQTEEDGRVSDEAKRS